jgi:hypothetical protein
MLWPAAYGCIKGRRCNAGDILASPTIRAYTSSMITCATGTAYRNPSYYIIAKYLWVSYRCKVSGIVNLLELISTTEQRLRGKEECSRCHYSDDTFSSRIVLFCGRGLVGDGSCIHYRERT